MSFEFYTEIYKQSFRDLLCRVHAFGRSVIYCGISEPDRRSYITQSIGKQFMIFMFWIRSLINPNFDWWITREKFSSLNSTENDKRLIFFIDAVSAPDKAFVINLTVKIKEKNNFTLTVASTGFEVALLNGRSIAHSVLLARRSYGKYYFSHI